MIHPFKHEEGEHHPHRIPEVASKGYFRLDAEFVQVIDQDSSLITDIKVCVNYCFRHMSVLQC